MIPVAAEFVHRDSVQKDLPGVHTMERVLRVYFGPANLDDQEPYSNRSWLVVEVMAMWTQKWLVRLLKATRGWCGESVRVEDGAGKPGKSGRKLRQLEKKMEKKMENEGNFAVQFSENDAELRGR